MAETTFAASCGLSLHCADAPTDPLLEAFYRAYDSAFVLPDEKEDLAGFRACLALNQGGDRARLLTRFGPYREVVARFHERDSGEPVGGVNFIAFVLPEEVARQAGAPPVSASLNYLFVDRACRGRGNLRRMLAALREAIPWVLGSVGGYRPVIFLEQNDPMLMSDEAYRQDSEHSGTDQFDRLAIWARMGAQIVDHHYVQPALSPAQAADDGLLLAVIGYPVAGENTRMDACFLREHLERFFTISVLKGRAARGDTVSAAQLGRLDVQCAAREGIALLDCMQVLRRGGGAALRAAGPRTSFRNVLRHRDP